MVIYHYCEYENIQNIFKMEEIKMNEMYQNQNVQPQPQPMMMGGGYGGYPYQQPYQPQQPYYQQPYQYNYNTNNCGGITFGEMPKQGKVRSKPWCSLGIYRARKNQSGRQLSRSKR